MENKSTDRVTDTFDQASVLEEMFRDMALAAHKAKTAVPPGEVPDEDEDGNRYCIACGDEIPKARVALLPHAVRCVKCEARRENMQRIATARGGFSEAE